MKWTAEERIRAKEHDYAIVWLDVIGWWNEEVAADPRGQHGCGSFRAMFV